MGYQENNRERKGQDDRYEDGLPNGAFAGIAYHHHYGAGDAVDVISMEKEEKDDEVIKR